MQEIKEKIKARQFIRFAFHAVPEMLQFQLLTKGLLAAAIFGIKALGNVLVEGMGIAAITGSDITKLLRSWQGWLLILLLLVTLFFYTELEILAQIINSRNIIDGRKQKVWHTYLEGIRGLRSFVSASGIPLIIFITFAVPLIGVGYTISLTSEIRLPNFITSVIFGTPGYMALYVAGIAAALWFSFINIYTFPGVMLSGEKVKAAKKVSAGLVKKHLADFPKLFLPVIGIALAVSFVIELLFGAVPELIAEAFGSSGRLARFPVIFLEVAGDIAQFILNMLITGSMILLVTVLYRLYREGRIVLMEEKNELVRMRARTPVLTAIGLCAFYSVYMEVSSADFFTINETAIIAHRAGGDLAAENSAEGVEAAIREGAYGSEIDVQRTKDGFYIINHDSTFSRLCGNPGKPENMTLEEIRQLTIRENRSGKTYTAGIPTIEEMLDISSDREVLFIELKGNTADRQMADDIVGMIKERNLLGNCVVISLKRDLISYTENTYPEVNTGLLYYMGYGPFWNLDADLLIMEEDTANMNSIEKVHKLGKKVIVWTVNSDESMRKFLDGKADGIITDHVKEAEKVAEELNSRTDAEKFVTALRAYLE